MGRYEHLPIYRAAFGLCLDLERFVRGFSRYNKYALGAQLRQAAMAVLRRIVRANAKADRLEELEELRVELEELKILIRLAQEAKAFQSLAVTSGLRTASWISAGRTKAGCAAQKQGEAHKPRKIPISL